MFFVLIGVFGALGAVSRYAISNYFSTTVFPLGTLVVNVLGSLLIGVLLMLKQKDILIGNETIHLALIVGYLGAFTTFSTFSAQTFDLFSDGEVLYSFFNIIANVSLCLLAVFIGHKFTQILF